MKLTFLSAAVPLTKTIGPTSSQPYPSVRDLTSTEQRVTDIASFYDALCVNAKHGCALLKGNLTRSINQESRANLHDPDALTEWVVLDFDGLENIQMNDLLRALGVDNIDHIIQYSASSGIKPGIRCHVFFLLDKARLPAEVKRWIQMLNLTVPELVQRLTLNKNGLALRWPVDICVADNSRIIYIAPPVFEKGVTDPHPNNRYVLRTGAYRHLDIGVVPQQPQIRAMIDAQLTKLQPPGFTGKVKTRWIDMDTADESYAIPAHYATVTGVKEGPDFIYLNLNGGDSWGYYHSKTNPVYLNNFKGEPIYRLVDIVPRYAKKLAAEQGIDVQLFMDIDTEEFILIKNGNVHRFRTKDGCKSLANKHNYPVDDFSLLEPIKFIFNPTLPMGIGNDETLGIKVYNQFSVPEIPKTRLDAPWTNIELLIKHLCVDDATYTHFMNWLAYIFQTHKKTRTAWIMCGVQGTGKGTLFNEVIAPLIGRANVTVVTTADLEEAYNNYTTASLFLLYDEASYNPSRSHSSVENKLKHLITEPFIRLNEKYVRSKLMDNFTNVIITSNDTAIIRLDPSDRRYNITPRQEKPLTAVCNTHELIPAIKQELNAFYTFLMAYPVDEQAATTVLRSAARESALEYNTADYITVSRHLLKGDLQYFLDARRTPKAHELNQLLYVEYNNLVDGFTLGATSRLPVDSIRTIFAVHCANVPTAATAFGRYLSNAGLVLSRNRDGRFIEVTWR